MSNLTPQSIERLQATVQEGEIIKDFCRHPGFKILERFIESKISDDRKEWLRASSKDEAELVRIKCSVWVNLLDEVKKFILSGNNAKRLIEEHNQDNLEQNPPPHEG